MPGELQGLSPQAPDFPAHHALCGDPDNHGVTFLSLPLLTLLLQPCGAG